jgi:hypothetical protein
VTKLKVSVGYILFPSDVYKVATQPFICHRTADLNSSLDIAFVYKQNDMLKMSLNLKQACELKKLFR